MSSFLNLIFRTAIYFLVFLLPLFWLPFSFEFIEYNKQYLLFFLASFSLLIWLAKAVLVEKEIKIKIAALDFLVLAFLATAALSAVFSVDKVASLFGFYGRFSNGLIGLFSFGVLYFLITNNTNGYKLKGIAAGIAKGQGSLEKNQKPLTVEGLLKVFFGSTLFVILISYLSVFGFWQKIPLKLPPVLLQRIFNPASGSLEGLTIFLSIVIVFVAALIISSKWSLKRLWQVVLLGTGFGLLVIVDFRTSWIILLIGLSLLLFFSLVSRIFKENINRLLLPIILIFISAVFLLFDLNLGTKFSLAKEQVLDQKTSWQIPLNSLSDNFKRGLLGTGIGTWHYDFSKYRPAEYNQGPLWLIRFDRSASHFSEILATTGLLGFLSYIFVFGFVFLAFLLSSKKSQILPWLALFSALAASQLFYYQNTVLAFIFWLFLGISAVSFPAVFSKSKWFGEKIIFFKSIPELGLVFSALLLIVALSTGAGYYFAQRFFKADIVFARSLQTAGSQERISLLEKAVKLNPYESYYRMTLASDYLAEALSEQGKSADKKDLQKIIKNANLALAYIEGREIDGTGGQEKIPIKGAAQISPNRAAVWENLGVIYQNLWLITTNGQIVDWQIGAFEKALSLDPTNPALLTLLGKLYLPSRQEIENNSPGAEEKLAKAGEKFERALRSKPDFLPALFEESLFQEKEAEFLKTRGKIAESENKLVEALQGMESLANGMKKGVFPLDIEVFFQLGRLYFNGNKTDEAIIQFETALFVQPDHSNSLFALAVAYQKRGENALAKKIFERVLELNPGNTDVIERLRELK